MRKVAGRAVTRVGVKMMMALGAVTALVLGMVVLAFPASAHTGGPTDYVRQILSGQSLHHWYTRAGSRKQHRESLTQPDDITMTGGHLFTGFQNGVGPQGQASTDGNRDSTIVEFASASCPGSGFPANYLGQLNMYTGQITRGEAPRRQSPAAGHDLRRQLTGGAAGPDRSRRLANSG